MIEQDRCAICGWPLDPEGKMCRRGNCSMRPFPERYYDPARARVEYGASLPLERHPHVASPDYVIVKREDAEKALVKAVRRLLGLKDEKEPQ